MKRIFVLVLALCLVVPAISYAGSATSRWDLTIGGTVKTTIGYSLNKSAGDLSTGGVPTRDDKTGFSTANNKYGNWIWGGGETGLNFTVRGPDAWGAKTSAFIAGDFVGVWGGATYGSFDLVVSTINLDWANSSLQFGMAGGGWGMFPTFAGIGWSDFTGGFKGPAPVNPQVNFTQRLTKEFSVKFGLADQSDNNSGINSFNGGPTSFTRGDYPLIFTVVKYESDKCGKVGPWLLTFKASGAWAQDKRTFAQTDRIKAVDKSRDMWYADFGVLVPIIPQKNDGNKGGALYFDGLVQQSQDFDAYLGGIANFIGDAAGVTSYTRPFSAGTGGAITSTPDVAANKLTSGYAHVGYYFTDAFSFNAFYMYATVAQSAAFHRFFPNDVRNFREAIAQFQYEVNPALKFQVFWDHALARFNGNGPTGTKNTGLSDSIKFSAFYYF